MYFEFFAETKLIFPGPLPPLDIKSGRMLHFLGKGEDFPEEVLKRGVKVELQSALSSMFRIGGSFKTVFKTSLEK